MTAMLIIFAKDLLVLAGLIIAATVMVINAPTS